MTRTADTATTTRSGHCNLSWPLDVEWGARSHRECTLPGCVCTCHQTEEETP